MVCCRINLFITGTREIIKISAYLREVVCVEINLSNPLEEVITFNVAIIGEGLFGENKMILQPKENVFINCIIHR